MIIEAPELRPTTAIKHKGISDPSTIRRLRDKFNAEKELLFRELRPQAQPESKCNRLENQSAPAPRHNTSEIRTMALVHPREPARSEPVTKKSGDDSATRRANDSDEESRRYGVFAAPNEFTARQMLSNSLRTASAVWQLQFYVASQTIQSPLVRSVMHYQLAFSQSLFGFGGVPSPGR